LRGCALDAMGFRVRLVRFVATCCGRPLLTKLHEH
jgi:hypothetical protein